MRGLGSIVIAGVLLATGCGDDGTTGGEITPTDENIAGIYVEQTGESYTAIDLRLSDGYLLGNSIRLLDGTTAGDPTITLSDTYNVIEHRLELRQNRAIDIDYFDGTMLRLQGHTYQRATECPMAPRNGAWLWSQIYSDGSPAGTLSMALGPSGPAMAMGGPNGDPAAAITYVRRLGCQFTVSLAPLALGEVQPRLLYGPDGLPQIAAIRSTYNSISLARFDPTMPQGWVVIPVDVSSANDGSAPIGMAIAADGSTWISHAIMGDADFGLGVSHVAVDGTVTHSDIIRTGGHHHSRLVLDAAGTPHVAYQNVRGDGVFIATMTGPTTWSIEGPISTGTPRELSGFAMSSTGAYHVGWTEDIGQTPYARYSTNVSGSWVTVALATGRGVDVALDSQDRPLVTYVHDPDTYPYMATNTSGTWVDSKIETAGVPGGTAPVAGVASYYLGWTSLRFDADDKMHLAFGNLAYATTAY